MGQRGTNNATNNLYKHTTPEGTPAIAPASGQTGSSEVPKEN